MIVIFNLQNLTKKLNHIKDEQKLKKRELNLANKRSK